MEAVPGGPADGGGGGQRHQVRGPAGAALCEEEVAGGRGEECQAAEGARGHAEPGQVGHDRATSLLSLAGAHTVLGFSLNHHA